MNGSRVALTCGVCRREFSAESHEARIYCSQRCYHTSKTRTLEERFWKKVAKGDGCWTWTGAVGGHGYGNIGAGGKGSRTLRAHRVSFELEHGPIPEGVLVLHRCDNRRCVNPEHLFLGDSADNSRDMWTKGRASAPPRNTRRGESSPKAKLTRRQVVAIRKAAAGGKTHRSIALAYGVTEGTIGKIVHRVRWKHVA